jgi:hypothetical protein
MTEELLGGGGQRELKLCTRDHPYQIKTADGFIALLHSPLLLVRPTFEKKSGKEKDVQVGVLRFVCYNRGDSVLLPNETV